MSDGDDHIYTRFKCGKCRRTIAKWNRGKLTVIADCQAGLNKEFGTVHFVCRAKCGARYAVKLENLPFQAVKGDRSVYLGIDV